ncbi:unnamed protein product [Fraxinus pennsylvanica]|uniref:Uncharacterized protein n=1 Tax=Fraxinus pennsylvanica TaxID=56036 RepID=A0AAD1ZUQ7_9LAMI|nr:unnamed protein product [Fraxinus pennsylvanica]
MLSFVGLQSAKSGDIAPFNDSSNDTMMVHQFQEAASIPATGVDDILERNEDLVVKNSAKLLPGRLEYSRLVDANMMELSNGPVKSVQFHKNAQLLLAAGLDKMI